MFRLEVGAAGPGYCEEEVAAGVGLVLCCILEIGKEEASAVEVRVRKYILRSSFVTAVVPLPETDHFRTWCTSAVREVAADSS
jgi:hypothetical protein